MMDRIPEKIKHYARLIQHCPVEMQFCFTEDIRLKFSYIGDKMLVPSMSDKDAKKDVPYWQGLYTLHNHSLFPITFSIPDLWCAVNTKLIGQFVVRADGVIHAIAPKQKHWHPDLMQKHCLSSTSTFLGFQAWHKHHPLFELTLLEPRIMEIHRKMYDVRFAHLIQGFDVHYLTETL